MSEADDPSNGAAVEYSPNDDQPESYADGVRRRYEDELMSNDAVMGTGIGQNAVGDDAIILYLRSKADRASFSKSLDGVDLIFEVTGEIDAQ